MLRGHKNNYTGLLPIEIAGKQYNLQFTWAAIAALQTEFGIDYDSEISSAVESFDTAKLAKIISIGIGNELTADEILANSPPLIEICTAIMDGIKIAYYGPKVLQQKKKKLVAQFLRLDLLKMLFSGGAKQATPPKDSGS
jgi:hypothetical protein